MKILAFVDMHASLTALKKLQEKAKQHKPDVIVCAGDLSIFEDHLEILMKKISKLGSKVLLIHGNHETESVMKKICSYYSNMVFIHKNLVKISDVYFLGFSGEGFSKRDPDLERYEKRIKDRLKGKKVVLVTHAPPYNTRLDIIGKEHCGNKTITNFIKSNPSIILHICGHFHESSGEKDKIKDTPTINPGPWGKIIEI